MQPMLVERVTGAFDNTVRTHRTASFGRVVSGGIADILTLSMIEAVNRGTATHAAASGAQVAGKTGTAQNETGIDHSWFVGFAPAYAPRYALAIVIEQTGGGTQAVRLAGQVFEALLLENY